MRTNITRPNGIIHLAAFVLFAFCFIHTQSHDQWWGTGLASLQAIAPNTAAAQTHNGTVTGFDAGVVIIGIAHGQTIRFTVLNQNEPRSGGSIPARVQVKLIGPLGNTVSQSAEVVIPVGEFRSIDFNRDGISLPGEEGTGRLQVRAETEVRSPRFVQIDGRVNFPSSVEIVDNSTGETRVLMSQKPKEIVVVGPN